MTRMPLFRDQEVAGSSPVIQTRKKPGSSLAFFVSGCPPAVSGRLDLNLIHVTPSQTLPSGEGFSRFAPNSEHVYTQLDDD